MSDKHIAELYKKIKVRRVQEAKLTFDERTRGIASEYIFKKLEWCVKSAMLLPQNPKVSKQQIDQVMRDVSKTMDYAVMNLDPEVIQTLIMEELRANLKKKVLSD